MGLQWGQRRWRTSRWWSPGPKYTRTSTGTANSSGSITILRGKVLVGALITIGDGLRSTVKTAAGVLTATGTVVRNAAKALVSVIAMSGVLIAIKTLLRSFTSVATINGNAIKAISTPLTSAISAIGITLRGVVKATTSSLISSSTLIRNGTKAITGILTSSGISVVLKTFVRVLTGTMGSSSTLRKQIAQILNGAGVISGALVQFIRRQLVRSLASIGALRRVMIKLTASTIITNGIVLALKAFLRTITRSLTTNGTLKRSAIKLLGGSLSAIGIILRNVLKTASGNLTANGTAFTVNAIMRSVTAALTPSGHAFKSAQRRFSALISTAKVHSRLALKALGASIASSAFVNFVLTGLSLLITATIATSGNVRRAAKYTFNGIVTSASISMRSLAITLTNLIASISSIKSVQIKILQIMRTLLIAGAMRKHVLLAFISNLTLVGTVRRFILRIFIGIASTLSNLLNVKVGPTGKVRATVSDQQITRVSLSDEIGG